MKKGVQIVFVVLMICVFAFPAFAGQAQQGNRLMTMTKAQTMTKVQAKQQIHQRLRDGSCTMTGSDQTDVPTDDGTTDVPTETPTDDTTVE